MRSKFSSQIARLVLVAILVTNPFISSRAWGYADFVGTSGETATESRVDHQAENVLDRYHPNRGQNAFCYTIEKQKTVEGINENDPVRIASVMKLMTSFWAVETLGPNYRYQTKVYINRKSGDIHIDGSRDPFFDRDRLYMLISDLNQMGIKHADRLSSDRSFYMNPDLFEWQYAKGRARNGYMHTEAHVGWLHGDASLERDLQNGFNTGAWGKAARNRYQTLRARFKGRIDLASSLQFSTDRIALLDKNPLAGVPGTEILILQSLPIQNYLKIMNMWSLNAVADELFHSLGGSTAFRSFLQDRFSMGDDALTVYSGSGLELNGAHRLDTKMTCSTVVRLIRRLDLDLEQKYSMDITDIMMVAGVDSGTFSNSTHALAAKTGTLSRRGYRAKNVAGVVNTRNVGEVYLGIFMQTDTPAMGGIRTVLLRVFNAFGGTIPYKSKPFSFTPLRSDMRLRKSDGSPIAKAPIEVAKDDDATPVHPLRLVKSTASAPQAVTRSQRSKPVDRTAAPPKAQAKTTRASPKPQAKSNLRKPAKRPARTPPAPRPHPPYVPLRRH